MNRSPVIGLNRAAAVAMISLERGLKQIDELKNLDHYYLFHAARADILRRMNRREEAAASYRQALLPAANRVEQDFPRRRLREVARGGQICVLGLD